MKKEIFVKGRNYEASATYDDGIIIIHKGSKIGFPATAKFKRTKKAYALRENDEIVQNGIVIKECSFDSPSTAAQFITGGSRNGYDTWKIEKGYSLGQYLEDKGVRIQNKVKKG